MKFIVVGILLPLTVTYCTFSNPPDRKDTEEDTDLPSGYTCSQAWSELKQLREEIDRIRAYYAGLPPVTQHPYLRQYQEERRKRCAIKVGAGC